MADSPVTSDEFSKEEVEALLKEEPEADNKRLKLCIKWFQQVNENLNLDKVKLQSDLEAMEKKWFNTEMDMIDIADHITKKKLKLRTRYTAYKKRKRAEVADLKNLRKAADKKVQMLEAKLAKYEETLGDNGWDRLNTKALSLEACSSQRAEKLEHQLAAVNEECKKPHLSTLEAGS